MKYKIYKYLIFFLILILILTFFIKYNNKEGLYNTDIPIVIICWNNYYFIKNFINQIKKYNTNIIVLDNKSTYVKLLDYYKEIKNELKDRIDIRLLDKNYGSNVYVELKNELPQIYILSDPDLELNTNMPDNFIDILLNISNQYKSYKVGAALNIKDKNDFIECENYFKEYI